MKQDVESRDISIGNGLMKIPERLLLAHARGKVLFVCGAGISRPAGLPDFGGLVNDVYRQLDPSVYLATSEILRKPECPWKSLCAGFTDPQSAEVGRFAAGEFDVVLGMLERRLDGAATRDSRVRSAVAQIIREAGEKPAPTHRALIRLADRGGSRALVTTNFDLLLEKAGRPRPRTHSLGAMPRPTERPDFSGVFHIHGAMPSGRNQVADLVLSDQDFGDFYLRRRVVPDFIYDAARLYHLVLVGYSANDPPMRYLLNAVAADGIHFDDIKERFSFVGESTPDPIARAEWKARGITPIVYDSSEGHAQLRRGLEKWAKLSPFSGLNTPVDREIRRIVGNARTIASEADRDLLEHLFRRADYRERLRLTDVAKNANADLSWLDSILRITRERVGRRPS